MIKLLQAQLVADNKETKSYMFTYLDTLTRIEVVLPAEDFSKGPVELDKEGAEALAKEGYAVRMSQTEIILNENVEVL